MTEKNSKHSICVSIDNYQYYVDSFKIFRFAKVSEISTFNDSREACYMGYGREQIKLKALIDKSRLEETQFMLNTFKSPTQRDINIDGTYFGKYIVADYEICASSDSFIYEVSISMYKY